MVVEMSDFGSPELNVCMQRWRDTIDFHQIPYKHK